MENRETGGSLAHKEEPDVDAGGTWNEMMRLKEVAENSGDTEGWERVWFFLKEQREKYPQLPKWLPGEREALEEVRDHVPYLSEAIETRLNDRED